MLERTELRELSRSRRDIDKTYTFHVTHLARYPLNTPYWRVVESVGDLLEDASMRGDAELTIDIPGSLNTFGMFTERWPEAIGVVIVSGWTESKEKFKLIYHVLKRNLVSGLQVAFQNGDIKISDRLPSAKMFINELLSFESKIKTSGHDVYGAWREGAHDDLVLAVSLAFWYANQKPFVMQHFGGSGEKEKNRLSLIELERELKKS